MIDAVFAVPGDLNTPTGGYAYARRLIEAAPRVGLRLTLMPLPGDFPAPSAASVEIAAAALAGVPPTTPLLVDGLAFGALPEPVAAAIRAPLAVLLHHPLGLEGGVPPEQAAAMLATEAAALRHARAVIVTSGATRADVITRLGVDAERLTVAVPGLDKPAAPAPRPASGVPLILSVGSQTPRKGHDVLLAALARMTHLPWRAVITGAETLDPACAAALAAQALPSGERVTLQGAVPRGDLDALYGQATLFVLASRHEGYGMVFAEAMAHGLPVVAARIPAAEEVVPPDAGLLVPRDDPAALAEALAVLLGDQARARAMGAAGATHAGTLPGWDDTAAIFAAVLGRLAP